MKPPDLFRSKIGSTAARPLALVVFITLVQLGCDDASRRLPLGGTCEESIECTSGRCVASTCIDPRAGPDGVRYVPAVAYVTRRRTGANIAFVALAADGTISEPAASPFSTTSGSASQLVFTPDGRHAYVASGNNGDVPVLALDVDPLDFAPVTNPYPPLQNESGLKLWDAVAMHPGGDYVFAADGESDGDRIYAYAIDEATQPGRLVQVDSSVAIFDVTRLGMDPLGRYLIAANDDMEYVIFDLEAGGALDGTFDAPEAQPAPDFIRSITFGAAGDTMYLLTAGGLHAFAFDRASAVLTEVVGSPFEVGGGDVLAVDPLGRFLYESGRGSVFVHRINPTGTVALVDIDDDALNGVTGYGDGVVDLAFDHTGDLLYTTGASTSSYLVGATGLLTLITTIPVDGERIAVLSVAR